MNSYFAVKHVVGLSVYSVTGTVQFTAQEVYMGLACNRNQTRPSDWVGNEFFPRQQSMILWGFMKIAWKLYVNCVYCIRSLCRGGQQTCDSRPSCLLPTVYCTYSKMYIWLHLIFMLCLLSVYLLVLCAVSFRGGMYPLRAFEY